MPPARAGVTSLVPDPRKGHIVQRRLLLIPTAVLAGALALTGCTSDDEPASTATPLATPSITSTPDDSAEEPAVEPTSETATYATIDELVTAIGCTDYKADKTPVDGATASGECGGFDLSLFATAADRDTYLNANQAESNPDTFLVGANWLVQQGPKANLAPLNDLLAKLGGFIVPTGS